MSKIIGIIAEDKSDVATASILIKRAIQKENVKIKHLVGGGCGKLQRKAFEYARVLKNRGCDLLVFIHDKDRNELTSLQNGLVAKLKDNPFGENHIICIPIEEIEAWLLSDPAGIKRAMNLRKEPKIQSSPELIVSPKEKLRDYIYLCSNKERIYINTKHNEIIAREIDLSLVKMKCPSFERLYDFVTSYSY